MGDFFKEEIELKEEKKEKLIEDFSELCVQYDMLAAKNRENINQSKTILYPIRIELLGNPDKDPNNTGQVGWIRDELMWSRLNITDLGEKIRGAIKNIKDLDSWQSRYTLNLEQDIEAFKLIARSGFKIIFALKKQLEEANNRIHKLEAQMVQQNLQMHEMKEAARETPWVPPEMLPDDDPTFKERIQQRLLDYVEARKSGSGSRIGLAKGKIFQICGKNENRRRYAQAEFEKLFPEEKVDSKNPT